MGGSHTSVLPCLLFLSSAVSPLACPKTHECRRIPRHAFTPCLMSSFYLHSFSGPSRSPTSTTLDQRGLSCSAFGSLVAHGTSVGGVHRAALLLGFQPFHEFHHIGLRP